MFDLEGRVILLTGAAGHLGAAISEAILNAGGELIMTGRSLESLEACRSRFDSLLQSHCHIFPGDITDEKTIAALLEKIKRQFSSLHGLVNNAYAGCVGTIDNVKAEDFNLACQYNLTTPFLLIKAFRTLLEIGSQKTGIASSVVNVASMYGSVSPDSAIYGDSGENNPVHYGATKGGLIQMTRYLACHLGSAGIRVNSIAPGPFPNTTVEPTIPFFFDKLTEKVPMKRLGRPREVAGPVVFLLSEAASYINGVNLPIDGGWTAW